MTMVFDSVGSAELSKQHGRLVAKAWMDAEFEAALRAAPHAVLAEHGIDVPAEAEVRFVADPAVTVAIDGDAVVCGLPSAPAGGLGDEVFSSSADHGRGGGTAHTTASVGCYATGNSHCTGPNCGSCGGIV